MMLDLKTRPAILSAPQPPAGDDIGRLADAVRLFLLRRYKLAIVLMVLSLFAGLAYLKMASPSYTAMAFIEIANREGQSLRQQATLADSPADIDRAIEIAKSRTLAESVSRKLHLAADPEFQTSASDLLMRLRSLWSGSPLDPETLRTRSAVSSVLSSTRVTTDPSGASLAIAFTSHDSQKSADIANALADEFIAFQVESDAQVRKQAADWLVGQSNELANRSKEAANAVSEFINKNNITIVESKSLEQLNLENVSKRVAEAKAKLLDAQHKLDRINASLNDAAVHDILDATAAAEVLQDPLIAKAREGYADLNSQLQAIKRDFGKAPQKLEDTLAAKRRELLAELSRVQRNALDDYQMSRKIFESAVSEQKVAADAAQHNGYLYSQLEELQSTSQNYRKLYENFLQHSAESARELSFPVRDARILERAEAPSDKSWPKPFIVLAAAAAAGLALGFGGGALRDFTESVFRTASQFESITRLKFLGLVPNAAASKAAVKRTALPPEIAERFGQSSRFPVWTKIKSAPNSRFVSELIAVQLALRDLIDLQGARVFGFTSALSGEGKSSLVSSMGVLMAQFGHRVVVVDLDLRNPTLTDLLAPQSRMGLADVLAGRRTLEDVLVHDATLELTILPSVVGANVMHVVELLTSARMRECIAKLRKTFDIVLIDLPPLLPVADVRATTGFIDSYVMIVEWARTPIALLRRAIEANPDITAKAAGGILNKVDLNKLSKYDSIAGSYYLRPEFSRYFSQD